MAALGRVHRLFHALLVGVTEVMFTYRSIECYATKIQAPATSQWWTSVKSQRLKAISSAQNSSLRNSQTLATEN